MDIVCQIEETRIRLGLKKKQICRTAKIKPEMYSYVLKRGRLGFELPEDCVEKIQNALKTLQKLQEKKA